MREKVEQLEPLNEFAALLNSTLDTAIVREKALEATCQLLRCETASLLLVDAKARELYWETALGDAGKELKNSIRLPIDDRSIAGYVAMTGESLIINDVANDPRHFKRKRPGAHHGFRRTADRWSACRSRRRARPSACFRRSTSFPAFPRAPVQAPLAGISR